MSGPFDPGRAAGAGQEEPQEAPTTTAPPSPSAPVPGLDSAGLGTLIGEAIRSAQPESKLPPFQAWLDSMFGGNVTGTDPDTSPLMRGLGARGTVHDVVGQVSRLSSAELSYLQRRLFQAGFYDAEVYVNAASIDWGTIDEVTIKALEKAFTKAAANQIENFDAFLEDQRVSFLRTGVTDDGVDLGSAIEGAGVVDVTLEDPAWIRLTAESTAVELLGRKPTEQELSRITAKLWAAQRENARSRAQASSDVPDMSQTATLLDGKPAIPFEFNPAATTPTQLTNEQADVARTIIQVGQEMGLSEEYIVGALSAGIVESGLRNVNYGDRDSLGVFQQRAHYGSAQKRLDVAESARMFYQEMLRTKPAGTLGEWVADTQRPAKQYRGRYGDVMDQAAGIFAHLSGQVGRVTPTTASIRQAERGTSRVDPGRTGILRGVTGVMDSIQDTLNTSPIRTGPLIPRDTEDEAKLWFDGVLSSSMGDPVFRETYAVNPEAQIAMALREGDPKAYETRQAALKAVEFFSLLGAGGGHLGG